uniref:Uncharacterized protein n=2 Tax=Wuchereria bancrofti TaxID=6293 RepID=A0AAF5RUS9_WUCBA
MLLWFIFKMWPNWTVVFVIYVLVDAVGTECSMDSLPKFDGEYIHYLLSWDCKLVVTRNWNGSSLREFEVVSDRLNICKSDGIWKPIHYVQVHPGIQPLPFLVFFIYFHKENGTNTNIWRVVKINITAIIYKKRLHRTILDSIFTEYSTLYTDYPLKTCTYHTVSSIYCFWQKGIKQWAQLYNVSRNNATLEYRAAGEAFYLEGHPNFGEIVGSLPGPIPRMLMFDYKIRGWLYEVPIVTNFTVPGRRIQEMRKIEKIQGKLGQVAAMSIQSFIVSDCYSSMCKYWYNSLDQIAKATTTCIFTSPSDAVSGVFEMSRNFLMPIRPKLEECPSQSKPRREEIEAKQWTEHCMVVIYAFTIAFVITIKILMEVCILTLHQDNISIFEQCFTTFYKCLFFGLTAG